MPAPPAPPLALRNGDRERLAAWTRSSSIRSELATRTRIVLLAADGVSNTEIAQRVGVTRQTVIDWRANYGRSGLAGLDDRPRSGRPRSVDRKKIIAATLLPPPKKYGVTHWSSRLLARHLTHVGLNGGEGLARGRGGAVAGADVQVSTDPGLVAKATDIVGLYLAPPENAIVLCMDEKSQIQALDRTAPMLPGITQATS